MNLLGTNFIIGEHLQPKIVRWLSVLPLVLMFSAFIPLFLLVGPLGRAMGIPGGAPVKEQPNGLLWLIAFIFIMVALMLMGYALGWLLNALIARYIFRWPSAKVCETFMYSNVPQEWRLDPRATSKTLSASAKLRNNWAITRTKGRWNFILVRGILGWGLPMFLGMSCLPVLTRHIQPTLAYFVPQIILWSLAGGLFGLIIWLFSERQFRKQHDTEA
ncbi:hypothetical protein HQ393_06970 [Chitinibacter bivalviorum]|uniref:Uncharacterized protein n=1 Tax=Chitinibacter bivalviorum TaxID=2739434 RepID=A0A7H9BI56_9NEIS|nr:hypothetical protein [Chitinibacter bivalviorum]QLG88022.1 hypothetical protein HQ393_06970 [Chitinibacter bivalviorum]